MHERVGPYRIVRKLGEGGMGVVYAAEDERLQRSVAIKTLRECGDQSSRERFFREARAAASLSHPNVCQLFDIGDIDGLPYLVMELLEGESLADCLTRGALAPTEAIRIELEILKALEALHTRGFMHRDLKPTNVFLASHGVKILDFGLAREAGPSILGPDATTVHGAGAPPLTRSGMIVGTPRYMSPEQLLATQVDHRTDIFAAGLLLYEMISGHPPFAEENVMQLFHNVVYESPPNLAGSAAISALNRIIHRSLAKRAEDRYQSAAAMAKDLREVMMMSDAGAAVTAHRITRLVALPLRVLRADSETDFLALALPEAITTSLAGIGSLVIRSSAGAARLAGPDLDFKKLATEVDVDVVLTGTLLRAGEQLRVTTQLVEVPAGTVLWSLSSQAKVHDVFELQDTLTQRIVGSLKLPLTDREAKLLRHDVPANPRAHEFYLRAGQQGESLEAWAVARDLYLHALEEDPQYAPAWARLARIYVLIGKYGGVAERDYKLAESAAQHALELNPDLPLAHAARTQVEVATGHAHDAMIRLLDQVYGGSNNPEVFSGLVNACRYCGLLEESAAAHNQARRLDPQISTSAVHTFWALGRYEEALAVVEPDRDFGSSATIYDSMGQPEKIREIYEDRARRLTAFGGRPGAYTLRIFEMIRAGAEGRREDAVGLSETLRDFADPEGLYYIGRALTRVGEIDRAIGFLERSERDGFFCAPLFVRDPALDSLRPDTRFIEILRRAQSRSRAAARAFADHPGSRVLTVGA